MEIQPPATNEGWYPDPLARADFRWWTGQAWTYRIAAGGQVSTSTVDLSGASAPAPTSPIGVDPNRAPSAPGPIAVTLTSAGPAKGLRPDRSDLSVSAGTAFKLGFFGFFGWLTASAVVGVLVLLVVVIFAACAAAVGRR